MVNVGRNKTGFKAAVGPVTRHVRQGCPGLTYPKYLLLCTTFSRRSTGSGRLLFSSPTFPFGLKQKRICGVILTILGVIGIIGGTAGLPAQGRGKRRSDQFPGFFWRGADFLFRRHQPCQSRQRPDSGQFLHLLLNPKAWLHSQALGFNSWGSAAPSLFVGQAFALRKAY